MLAEQNETIESLREKLKSGKPDDAKHLLSIPSILNLEATIERVESQDNNILGMIPSDNRKQIIYF